MCYVLCAVQPATHSVPRHNPFVLPYIYCVNPWAHHGPIWAHMGPWAHVSPWARGHWGPWAHITQWIQLIGKVFHFISWWIQHIFKVFNFISKSQKLSFGVPWRPEADLLRGFGGRSPPTSREAML